MFACSVGNEKKQDFLAEKFSVAYDFLGRDDLASLEECTIPLEHGVSASIQHYDSLDPKEASFESHERMIDLQYVIEGREYILVTKREGLVVKDAYNTERDVSFYEDTDSYSSVYLEDGDFVVLTPEDVHKPRVRVEESMPIKKIVFKIPV